MNERRIQELQEKLKFLQENPQAGKFGNYKNSQASFGEATIGRDSLRSIMNRRTDTLLPEHEACFAKVCRFRIDWDEWETGTAVAFKARYEAEHKSTVDADEPMKISPELLRALRVPVPETKLITTRGTPTAVAAQFASVMTFVDQTDIRRLSLEISGQPWMFTIADETGRPIMQRNIVLLRGQVELQLGGTELVGGLSALKQVVASYANQSLAEGVSLTVAGSARAPIIGFEVHRDYLDVLRPGFHPPLTADATEHAEPPDALLCLLDGLQDGTEVSTLVRAYHKDFYLMPDKPSESVGMASPIGQLGTVPLTTEEQQRIMALLWELSLEGERGGRVPGEIVVAYDSRIYKERTP